MVEFRVMKVRQLHVAIYGNVGILRGVCWKCGGTALIREGLLLCCDVPANGSPEAVSELVPHIAKRMVEPQYKRRRPSPREQKIILADQENACFYCATKFDTYVFKDTKLVRLRVNWDHFIPYVYSADNRYDNFVAACQICNGLKGSKMFDTEEDAKEYIRERWTQKGITRA